MGYNALAMRFLRLLLVVLLFLPEWADAQSFYAVRRERSIIGTLGLGTSSYFGDLKEEKRSIDSKPTINFGFQYYFTNRIVGRADLSWVQLSGSDKGAEDIDRQYRNLSFTANNIELSTTAAINMLPKGDRFYQRPRFNVYGFAGIGVLYSNPKAEYQGEKYALQPLQTEGVKYSKFHFVVPYGLGARVMVSPFFDISLEGGYRLTFTDYLDDVSTVHVGPGVLTGVAEALSDRRPEVGQPMAPAGTRRGDPSNNDSYFVATLKLEYFIPDDVFWNSNNKLYRSKRKAYYRKRR